MRRHRDPRGLFRLIRMLIAVPVVSVLLSCSADGDRQSSTDAAAVSLPVPDPEISRHVQRARPVLLVGLDGADWQLFDRYISSGDMPNLEELRAQSIWGVLRSEEPMLSPLVWTTMMTGVSPLDHRVLDFTRRNPESGQTELITSHERARPALWNMASAAGLEVAVYGFWATWPAEAVRGVLVSDRLYSFLDPESHPPELHTFPSGEAQKALKVLSRAEEAIGYPQLRAFLPWLQPQHYQRAVETADLHSNPVASLRRILVQTETYAQLALDRLRTASPDLTMLYLEGTDAIGHLFARYAPPHLPDVSTRDYARYSDVPRLYHRHLDRMLGKLREAAAHREATLILVSDHGFRWTDRPNLTSGHHGETAVLWHRPEGIYLMVSPDVQATELKTEAGGIRQVTATVLAALGLPPGRALENRPLPGARFASEAPVDYAASFARAQRPPQIADDETAHLEGLRALGYLGSSDTATEPSKRFGTMTAAALNNEARLLQAAGRNEEAESRFRDALALEPDRSASLINLGILLAETRQVPEAISQLERAVVLAPESVEAHLNLARALSLAGRWDEAVAQYDTALWVRPNDPSLRSFRAQALLEAGQAAEAATAFHTLVEEQPDQALLWVREAQALALAGEVQAAKERLETGLERLPQSGELRHAFARLLLSAPEPTLRDPQRALSLAQEVFSGQPTVEHGETLAVALASAGQRERARELVGRLLTQARNENLDANLVSRLERLLRRVRSD